MKKLLVFFSNLKPGVSGISLDNEHIRFAGPTLWNRLFLLYRDFFETHTVPENLKTGVILTLFKGKGANTNNKDNYGGIAMFPTLCKIYEMILLSRLEVFAKQKGFFSEMQFGFQEGIGCTEAFFTILETINHILEWECKIYNCFLDARKAFDTVWIDGLLFMLFIELEVGNRMWLTIKDLYTDVKAQILYSGSLSRQFKVSQGTGQVRILAPFMYNVYINALLNTLTNHAYAIFINGLRVSSSFFADDISLLTTQQSFLAVLMHICYCYSLKWRYEFNNSKSSVVTFGETKAVHYQSMKTLEWILCGDTVDELYEYKNFGVLKNYVSSFSSNVDDNIEKTRNKAGMIFSSHLDRRKVNPLIYVKFWRQACLPSLLFCAELFTLSPGLLLKLEHYQSWFLKHIFYVPSFTPGPILLKMSGLKSVASEIAIKKLLFLGRLITEPNMAPTVRNLFQCRLESYFDTNVTSAGVLLSISEAFVKYDLFYHFQSLYNSFTYPSDENWKIIVKDRIWVFENDAWMQFCDNHPDIHIIQTCFENISPDFLSLADEYPDLVTGLHTQARLALVLMVQG